MKLKSFVKSKECVSPSSEGIVSLHENLKINVHG